MVSEIEIVLEQIDREELADLALDLGNIDSPPGHERQVGEFVEAWLRQEGFKTRVLNMVPERPNVVGVYQGTGGGYALLFNSHMDTSVSQHDVWARRNCNKVIDHGAWREGDILFGNGVVNDKGLMACFLVAAKAIKNAGVTLKGDIILTAVSGEIEQEPVDEFQGVQYLSREIGARFMVGHGVIADYALIAETTGFCLSWVQAGKAVFKVTVFAGPCLYAPYIKRPFTPEENPNAIFQMARLIEKIEEWALSYEKKHTYRSAGGTLVPTINIAAVRGGMPHHTCTMPELCSLYLDCRTAPNQDVMALKVEIESIVKSLKLEGEVELFHFRRGYEAKNVDPLIQAIEQAHTYIFAERPEVASGPVCSMWRDDNVFSEAGIPVVNYGPGASVGGGNFSISLEDLYKAAQIYAMIILDLCNQEKGNV
jgi:acetylornithine deacetylase/succinyl-diaminopimelate desuccinylase-like protein